MKEKSKVKKIIALLICLCCITISIVLVFSFRKNKKEAVYDLSIFEDKDLSQCEDNMWDEQINVYQAELDNKEVPEDKTDIIINDVDMEQCKSNLGKEIDILEICESSDIYADDKGSFDTFVSKVVDDDIDNFSVKGRESKKTDLEVLREKHEFMYRKSIYTNQDIDKYFYECSPDQKLMVAYEKENGRSEIELVDIQEGSFTYINYFAKIRASENKEYVTVEDILGIFDKKMNALGLDYTVKDVKTDTFDSTQYYMLNSGTEKLNAYSISFVEKYEGKEILDVNLKKANRINVESLRNGFSAEYVEDLIYVLTMEHVEVKSVKSTVKLKETVDSLYNKFEKEVKENNRDNIYKEIHPYNISIKYIQTYDELIPIYAVTTKTYTYNDNTNTWTEEEWEYLFEIDGVDYSKCRE